MLVLGCPRARFNRGSTMRRARGRPRVHKSGLAPGVPQKGTQHYFLTHNFLILVRAHWAHAEP